MLEEILGVLPLTLPYTFEGVVWGPSWSGKGYTFSLSSLKNGSVFARNLWAINIFLALLRSFCHGMLLCIFQSKDKQTAGHVQLSCS